MLGAVGVGGEAAEEKPLVQDLVDDLKALKNSEVYRLLFAIRNCRDPQVFVRRVSLGQIDGYTEADGFCYQNWMEI